MAIDYIQIPLRSFVELCMGIALLFGFQLGVAITKFLYERKMKQERGQNNEQNKKQDKT